MQTGYEGDELRAFDDGEDFAALLEEYDQQDEPERGDIREAEILLIDPAEIVVDLGAKRDGIVPQHDIERLDPAFLKQLQVGDRVSVFVLNPSDKDGNLLVSLNLGLQSNDWQAAQEMMDSGEIVECEVIGQNPGGVLVRYGRTEGFIPNSHLLEIPQGLRGEDRSAAVRAMLGRKLRLKVIEVNQRRRRLILSQREAQRDVRVQQKARLMGDLQVGDVIEGTVTGVRDFGVFVDLGGADGLVHVSELAWHRVPHPGDLLNVGDSVKVFILELDSTNQRIALSLRRTQPDPWDVVSQTYEPGQVVTGKVSNVVEFGAFIVLPDGIEGLLHVTEMGDGTLTEPHSYVKRGDQVTVRIVGIEPERKRIGFTQKELGLSQPSAAGIDGGESIELNEEGHIAAARDGQGEVRLPLPVEDEGR